MITGDRGLCGSFNTNVTKAAGQFIVTEGRGSDSCRSGSSVARDATSSDGVVSTCCYETTGIFQRLSFAHAAEIADTAIKAFTSGEVTERASRLQRVQVGDDAAAGRRAAAPDSASRGRRGSRPVVDYLYEPSPEEIFRDLLPRHVQVQVYRALLESNAAFFAAQMTAMDAATRNSAEMIENLTLYMNKVRQAAITREIIEVVSGASAT